MITRLKRTLTAAAIGGLVLVGGVAVPATAAHATKGWCNEWYVGSGTYTVECYATAPHDYRAVVNCYPYGGGSTVTEYGPWRRNWIDSSATCPSGYEPVGTWMWD